MVLLIPIIFTLIAGTFQAVTGPVYGKPGCPSL
jgi:hypothetical protein